MSGHQHRIKVKHLFWRAGFGLGVAELEDLQDYKLETLVNELFRRSREYIPLGDDHSWPGNGAHLFVAEKRELRKGPGLKVKEANSTWFERFSQSPFVLREKMTLFWHGHFACSVLRGDWNVYLNNAIRFHALGNFKDLLFAVSREPAMLSYLNNRQNKKTAPNENFAREVMELFCLGIGNYTERDIKEAARAFTGWTSDLAGNFRIEGFSHDDGEKQFLAKRGNLNGDDVLNHILSLRSTSLHICRRVYKYFVSAQPNEEHIEAMASIFYDSNYSIEALMKYVFQAEWFYGPKIIGTKIKSPIEWLAGLSRNFDLKFQSEKALVEFQQRTGQVLFKPPNVAGWPGGKSWIDGSTLQIRLLFPLSFFPNKVLASYHLNASVLQKEWSTKIKSNWHDFEKSILGMKAEELVASLLQTETHPSYKEKLKNKSALQVVSQILSSLEYQLC